MPRFFLFLLLTYLSVFDAYALELLRGPEVTVTATQATIRWQTGSVSGSRVRYKTPDGNWQTQHLKGVRDVHEVELSNLIPQQRYDFEIATARRTLAKGEFKTEANPSKRLPWLKSIDSKKKKTGQDIPDLRSIWGDVRSLEDHYIRHGADFNSQSAEHYAQQAWLFLQQAIAEGFPAKQDGTDGSIRVFDPKTRSFAAYRSDGKARTFFKPNSPSYFERQPGKPVRLTRFKR